MYFILLLFYGMTNQTIMGVTKNDLSKELQIPKNKFTARDYMSEAQLTATQLLELLTANAIHESSADETVLQLHTKNCKKFESMSEDLHNKHLNEKKTVIQARQELQLVLHDQPSKRQRG